MFQINNKLYLLKGESPDQAQFSDFYSLDLEGRSVHLQEMKLKRSSASLSGLSDLLITVGGVIGDWDALGLSSCEKYEVSRNKWGAIGALNTPRYWSGSVVLNSRKAFCFCGTRHALFT